MKELKLKLQGKKMLICKLARQIWEFMLKLKFLIVQVSAKFSNINMQEIFTGINSIMQIGYKNNEKV